MADERPALRIGRAMAALAAEDVAGVIAAARTEARARVTRILADELTRAMLEQARGSTMPSPPGQDARAEPTPATPATAATDAADTTDTTVLYVLCVTAADAAIPDGTPGIAGDDGPRAIVHGDLAAVVCPVPHREFGEGELREHLQDMVWLERLARAHEGILEQIADETTLVPMRLCTLIENESRVRELLIREQEQLGAALATLCGKSEWGVKAYATAAAATREPDSGADDDVATGTDYMRRRRQAHERKQRRHEELSDLCGELHETLAELSADARSNPPQRSEVSGGPGEMLLNGAYLVEDERLTPFLNRLQELAEEYEPQGLCIESSGPWPAYNFVPDTLGVAW